MRSVLVAFSTLIAGCGMFDFVGGSELDKLRRNRERWEAFQIRDYDFDFRESCFCLPEAVEPVRVEVRSDKISRVVNLRTGEPVPPQQFVRWPTIDSLFSWTERSFGFGYSLEITYDATHRFPARVDGDIPGAVDDEFTRTATNLRPSVSVAKLPSLEPRKSARTARSWLFRLT